MCWPNLRAQRKGQPHHDKTAEQMSATPRGPGHLTVARKAGLRGLSAVSRALKQSNFPTLFINTQKKFFSVCSLF